MARTSSRGATGTTLASTLAMVLAGFLVIGGIVLLLGRSGKHPSSPERPRNVLLVVVDTLRANRLACYGYDSPTSPHIDALARRGTLYRRNYSQACWTIPSMISLMSARSVVDEVKGLPPNLPVLAESMRDAGFQTAGFVANAVLGKESGFSRGFDVYVSPANVHASTLSDEFVAWHKKRGEEAGSADSTKPYFAWVQFIDPHHPYEPDAAHDVFHAPRPDQDVLVKRWREAGPRLAELSPDPSTPDLESSIAQANRDSNRYDGEVLAVDDGVGRILAELERTGELANTLVILAADHGEMLYEHPQQPLIVQILLQQNHKLSAGVLDLFGRGHRMWFFDDLWNTPLILAGPGMPAGETRSGLSANLDVFATILDAVGAKAQPDLEGKSLWGGRDPERDRVFAHGYQTSAVVEVGGLKLIVHPPRLFLKPKDAPSPLELHDLSTDPLEEKDFATERPGECDRLARLVAEWRARSLHLDASKASQEQLNTLKRLGYTDDGK